jgi:hypothetical protein
MRMDANELSKLQRLEDGVPSLDEEQWQEILARSLSRVAERREQQQLAREQREREERMRYAFD